MRVTVKEQGKSFMLMLKEKSLKYKAVWERGAVSCKFAKWTDFCTNRHI